MNKIKLNSLIIYVILLHTKYFRYLLLAKFTSNWEYAKTYFIKPHSPKRIVENISYEIEFDNQNRIPLMLIFVAVKPFGFNRNHYCMSKKHSILDHCQKFNWKLAFILYVYQLLHRKSAFENWLPSFTFYWLYYIPYIA